MLKNLVEINYSTVVTLCCLLIFILSNNNFTKRIRRLFCLACALLLCLVAADSIEYWTASFDTLSQVRIWMSAIGYSLRPIIIFIIILLIVGKRKKNTVILWAFPLVINTIIAFSAFYTDIAYSYTIDNQFVRGPIGYFAFVTSGLYEVMLLICTIRMYKNTWKIESIISIFVIVMFVISTLMESIWKYEGVINTSGAIALTFYYLYLNTQQYKRDPLTNVLNRRCFFLDAERNMENLCAVVSIDLNDLKKWNDEYGHAKGDEAICTIVECIERTLPRYCFLYRVGGDEFSILCFSAEKSHVEQMMKKIKEGIEDTPFSCALGVSYTDGKKDFNAICREADQAMYEDKMRMKNIPISIL